MKSVTHFLTARNILAVDIHCQSCEKYGSNAMSESKVQNLVRQFKDGLAVFIIVILNTQHVFYSIHLTNSSDSDQ